MSHDELRMDLDQAERILARALYASGDPEVSLSLADLRGIARELDIPLDAVDAALVADLARPTRPNQPGRVLPGRVFEASRTLHAAEDDVRARARLWLARQEGLRLRRADGPLEVWERDPSLLASARSALRLQAGSGKLRQLGEVRVAVAGRAERTEVSLAATSSTPMAATAGTIAGSAVTGLTLGLIVGGWAWLLILLPLLVVGVVGGVAIGRHLTTELVAGLERALDGVEQGAAGSEDSVVDVISDLTGAISRKRRPEAPPRRVER